jgi:helicase
MSTTQSHSRLLRKLHTVIFLPVKQESVLQILCFSRGRFSQRKPTIRGKIEFYFKQELMWRPRRLFWEEQGKWKAYSPKNTIQEILSKSKKIILGETLSDSEKLGIRRFCKDFGINTKIEGKQLCPFCLIHNQVTFLPKKDNFWIYNRERKICKSCAIKELEKELKAKKVDLLSSPGFKKYAISILEKIHDSQEVVDLLTSGETSIGDLTLVQKVDKVSKNNTMKINEYPIPKILRDSLKYRGIKYFLPVQVKALQNGLLDNEDLLVVADTSAGKTLIAEIAGISHVITKKKFIFTVPLVALANTKFEDFKKFYGKNLKIGIQTGRSRIFSSLAEKKAFYHDKYSIRKSNIIVATYEGLDLLIRSGQINFNDIGCIVIDEVQTIADKERGPTLDCLLAKIRDNTQKIQVIALSATIGNPYQFADDLSLNLVFYDQRPIPLEQHMLLSRSEEEKRRHIRNLVKKEYKLISETGFKGQTIVFTNSRRKTAEIAEYLRQSGIKKAYSYHSGLSYSRRKRIESEFSNGKSPVVVSTFALGAGVDFPTSQVIFESLMMGNTVLEPNNFTQMVGRAGRLGKHDRGRSILLCLGESISSLDSRSEVEIAFELIKSDLLPIIPNHSEDSCGEQILSICSTKEYISPKKAKRIYQKMIGAYNFDFMNLTNRLIQNSLILINIKNKQRSLQLTSLGRASALSFFSPAKTLMTASMLRQKKDFLSIVLEFSPPQNIYISKKLHSYLEKNYHMRFSTRLINSPVLDVMSASLKGKEAADLNKWCLNVFAKWTQNFFSCSCSENPYCDCGTISIGKHLINERIYGKNINQISRSLTNYELLIYPGDVLSFLNSIIHELEGIQRISVAIGRIKIGKRILSLIDKIESPTVLKESNPQE